MAAPGDERQAQEGERARDTHGERVGCQACGAASGERDHADRDDGDGAHTVPDRVHDERVALTPWFHRRLCLTMVAPVMMPILARQRAPTRRTRRIRDAVCWAKYLQPLLTPLIECGCSGMLQSVFLRVNHFVKVGHRPMIYDVGEH